jgi:UDP-glucose 4-epimerase
MKPESATHWVVGSGGMLGQAVVRRLSRSGAELHCSHVPWSDPSASVEALLRDAERLMRHQQNLRLVWCAGSGVVGTRHDELVRELETFDAFLRQLSSTSNKYGVKVRMFFASSAGGVYAGSMRAPFTEETPPRAISPYGEAKMKAEAILRRFATESGASVVLGRIANLYGPGQNLSKAQGVVSQLCRSHLQRVPLVMYVSLDTARDYLFCDDAARMVLGGLDTLDDEPAGTVVVKILASQQPTTLAAILGELRRITRRRPLVVLGQSPSSRFQVRDLRFRSVVWTHLDPFASTPLPVGIAATLQDVAWRLRAPIVRPRGSDALS